jgi:hypothetical protein
MERLKLTHGEVEVDFEQQRKEGEKRRTEIHNGLVKQLQKRILKDPKRKPQQVTFTLNFDLT